VVILSEPRAPNYELAEADYMNGMKYKDIASKYGVAENTVKSWKTRHKWNRKGTHTKTKKVCTQNKKGAHEEKAVADAEKDNPQLTDKQWLFCLYYVKYRNKTKAYQKAYQCSLENAQSHSYEMWKNVAVKKEINRLLQEYRSEIDLDIKDLFRWYLDIARADISDFVDIDEYGFKLRTKECIDGTLISEIKNGKYGISIKLQDKLKAMQWLSEHMGLATEEQKAKIEQIKAHTEKIKQDIENNSW